jgi:hypothetical protein
MAVALVAAACSVASEPSGSAASPASTPPSSTPIPTDTASAPTATPRSTPTATLEIAFRALDLPDEYTRGSPVAVDGSTAVGWVKIGKLDDEQPAIWDTTTGALRVLAVPDDFVHPDGQTFVRLVGVSGMTAVGTGVPGVKGKRGLDRAMAWDTQTGDLRILDIPRGFARTEAHAISGTTAVGQAWTTHGETGAVVAWDTGTGAVRILEMPVGYDCGNPLAMSGDTVVGIRCDRDEALPLIWSPLTTEARDLDLLPSTADGVPRAIDGTTAVGDCCFGEEGTPLPLIWDTATGAVRQLALPAPFAHGKAAGVSGSIAIGSADATPLVWDLETGIAQVLPPPAGYAEQYGANAVSGHTLVGSACQPPPSSSENPHCVPAAWTLP